MSLSIDISVKFGHYYISRLLHEKEEEFFSESFESTARITKSTESKLKSLMIKSIYEKFPRIQKMDVDKAFDNAVKAAKKKGHETLHSAKRAIRRQVEKELADINKKRRGARDSLSCVASVKSALKKNQPMEELIARAERILTGNELKVIRMCVEGKTVRKIAEEMGTSFPTAWRILNSGLDKMRVSNGMRPRHMSA